MQILLENYSCRCIFPQFCSDKYPFLMEFFVRLEAPAPCCPVKQVTGEGEAAGLFVLRGKTPDRKSHCSDNCIYVKVGISLYLRFYYLPINQQYF